MIFHQAYELKNKLSDQSSVGNLRVNFCLFVVCLFAVRDIRVRSRHTPLHSCVQVSTEQKS